MLLVLVCNRYTDKRKYGGYQQLILICILQIKRVPVHNVRLKFWYRKRFNFHQYSLLFHQIKLAKLREMSLISIINRTGPNKNSTGWKLPGFDVRTGQNKAVQGGI